MFRTNMTKLQDLNAYLTERLMVAAQEILEVVGHTISEYQRETVRAKKENDELKRRLHDVAFQANFLFEPGRPVAPGAGTPPDQLSPEQERCCSPEEDMESLMTGVKQELPEQDQNTQRHGSQEAVTVLQASSYTYVKSPPDDKFLQPSLPFDVRAQEVASPPEMFPDNIKADPDGTNSGKQEQTSSPQCLKQINENDTTESYNCVDANWMECGGVIQQPDEQESHRKMSTVSCTHCGKTFGQLSELKLHFLVHTGEKQYCCTTCGKSFKKPDYLKLHQRIHSGKMQNCCTVCGKCFAYRGKLKEHQRIHTGEKPFGCSVCGKCFSQSVHLKVHLRVHTGEKPYSCPVCGKRFNQSSQIKRHLIIHSR